VVDLLVVTHFDTSPNDKRICPMSGRAMPEWVENNTRAAVLNRSGGICEYHGNHRAEEMHHRKSRGVGGEWHPANILHLCARIHRYFTDHPQEGYNVGVCVQSYADPEEVPVARYDNTLLYLSDDITS